MAKEVKNENLNINDQIKQTKKKMIGIFAVVLVIVIGAGGLLGYKMLGTSKAEKEKIEKELEVVAIKDYPEDKKDKTIYSRDIVKQAYVLKDGIMSFEGTIVFYNKLAANLYSGVLDRETQMSATPDIGLENVFGDKIAKDAINRYLQTMRKSEISSTEIASEGIKDAINKQFKDSYGQEIVKQILVTTHITQ